MKVYINGQSRDIGEQARVSDVIADLGLTGKKIAVELNQEILPFQQHTTHVLQAEDHLEIVHAIGGGQDDSFVLAGVTYHSRLLVGTGKYKDLEETRLAIEASGAQIVTVAIRRTNIGQNAGEPNLLDVISPDKYTILPNTAGCYTVDEAVRTCRLGRELLGGHNLVKLEVLADQQTLFPNVAETYLAAEILVKDGFDVMVYTNDDPIAAKRLEEIGCVAVMPLAAPIGSGLGIRNPYNILTIVENAKVPILVDAGVGTASDAAIAMELGCAGVLMNTAIAEAKNPILMASAMRKGIEAGREAYLAGRMPRKRFASASSPIDGLFF
jgi:thiazole synthase